MNERWIVDGLDDRIPKASLINPTIVLLGKIAQHYGPILRELKACDMALDRAFYADLPAVKVLALDLFELEAWKPTKHDVAWRVADAMIKFRHRFNSNLVQRGSDPALTSHRPADPVPVHP
jgi:hypothetical protein